MRVSRGYRHGRGAAAKRPLWRTTAIHNVQTELFVVFSTFPTNSDARAVLVSRSRARGIPGPQCWAVALGRNMIPCCKP